MVEVFSHEPKELCVHCVPSFFLKHEEISGVTSVGQIFDFLAFAEIRLALAADILPVLPGTIEILFANIIALLLKRSV